jgi:hypothetical protein
MSDGHKQTLVSAEIGVILETLRAEVRARRLAQRGDEATPAERELRRALDEIELYRVISAHWPLLGKTLPQRAIALLNKLVRRYLRWYINPIVEQQNAYNDAVARTLRLLAEAYADLGEQIAEQQATNDERRATTDDRPLTKDDPRPTNDEPRTTNHERRTLNDAGSVGDNDPSSSVLRPSSADSTYAALMSLVRERAAAEPAPRFPDLALRALEPQLRLREQVSAHWPLPGKTLPQRAIALRNKLVRRYLRWYVNPIAEQQNAANAAFTVALLRLIALDGERRTEIARTRARRASESSQ